MNTLIIFFLFWYIYIFDTHFVLEMDLLSINILKHIVFNINLCITRAIIY